MNSVTKRPLGDYDSPSIAFYQMNYEGMLCVSGSHELLEEDDEWINNIK